MSHVRSSEVNEGQGSTVQTSSSDGSEECDTRSPCQGGRGGRICGGKGRANRQRERESE